MYTGPWNNGVVHGRDYSNSAASLSITGQVSGGFSFRGNTPYYGANQLRLSLPSENVSDFMRDSIGIVNVQSGRSYSPEAYFSTSSSTYMLSDSYRQAAGDVGGYSQLYGTNVAPNSITQVAARGNYSTSLEVYTSSMDAATVSSMVASSAPGAGGDLAVAAAAVDSAGIDAASGYYRASFNPLFGYVASGEMDRLGEQLLDIAPRQNLGGDAEQPSPSSLQYTNVAVELENVYAQDAAAAEAAELADRSDNISADDAPGDDEQDGDAKSGIYTSSQLRQLGSGDVFVGVLLAHKQSDALAEQRSSTDQPLGDTQLQQAVLTHLGGSRSDRFNRLMSSGDKLMAAGEFYQAAMRYQVASRVGQYNPLAPLGEALAYMAAGEGYRAGLKFEQAMAIYPRLMEVRVDLDTLVGSELLEKRRSELKARLSNETELDARKLPLIITLSFLELNSSNIGEARKWAEHLEQMENLPPRLRSFSKALLAASESE